MNRRIVLFVSLLSLWMTASFVFAQTEYRLGGGIHYWYVLDDIEISDIDETGYAWVLSYQVNPSFLLKYEFDLEMLPEGFGGSEEQVFAPQAYLLLGEGIYGGLGIGLYFSDGEIWEDPFFNLRGGLDIEILPSLHLDIQANYRFGDWEGLDEALDNVDTDTVTLAVIARIEL